MKLDQAAVLEPAADLRCGQAREQQLLAIYHAVLASRETVDD